MRLSQGRLVKHRPNIQEVKLNSAFSSATTAKEKNRKTTHKRTHLFKSELIGDGECPHVGDEGADFLIGEMEAEGRHPGFSEIGPAVLDDLEEEVV